MNFQGNTKNAYKKILNSPTRKWMYLKRTLGEIIVLQFIVQRLIRILKYFKILLKPFQITIFAIL